MTWNIPAGGGGLAEPVTLTEVLTSEYVLAEVVGAAIVNAGTGGTPGAATVTTTTGTGTPAQISVTIGAGGDIESIDDILAAGAFTVLPTDPGEEPVTGGGLTGATLDLTMYYYPVFVGSQTDTGYGFDRNGGPIITGRLSLYKLVVGEPFDIPVEDGRIDTWSLFVSDVLNISTSTPAAASALGIAGTITWDADFIYVCTETDTWKRVAIATW